MQCEICAKIIDKGKKVRLEGSVVTTCEDCARYGNVVEEVSTIKKSVVSRPVGVVLKRKKETPEDYEIKFEEEVVDTCAKKIKNARERAGLKQDELARMIHEPASLIHRIESNRIEAPIGVAKKIENKLKIKLVKKAVQTGETEAGTPQKKEGVTLGDLVVVRGRKNN